MNELVATQQDINGFVLVVALGLAILIAMWGLAEFFENRQSKRDERWWE